jgi:hypothetical protein
MAYTGGHPSMPPPVILPPSIHPGGRVGQMVGQQQATLRKHRHDDEEQGKLFVGGLRYLILIFWR